MHDVAQAWMLVTSAFCVWAVARTDWWHKWGYVAGLASEPAYIYMAHDTQSWGLLILTAWWTWYWGVGALRRFGKNAK